MRSAFVLLIAAAVGVGDGTRADEGNQARATGADVLSSTIAARAIRPGELILLTTASARQVDEIRVRAFGRDVQAFGAGAQTWQALIGIDVDARSGPYTIDVEARADAVVYREKLPLRVRPRTFPVRRLQVDPSFVNPPPEAERRIADEARLLNGLWTTSAASRLWSGRFVRPVPGRSSSRFGAQSIFNKEARGRHSGEDFSGDEGTPVVAPNAGRIALAQDLYFSGQTVVIDHGLGLFSLLAHLSAIDVEGGEAVTTGQQIGRLGATGRVTGPHLHWAVRLNGTRIDPSSLLATLGGPN